MGFFVCEFEKSQLIFPLALWGIRCLYRYLTTSDGSTSNKDTPPITTIPITSKVGRKVPQPTPSPEIVNPRPSPLTSSVIKKRKVALGNKRKLFRNILLVDVLMQRKDFIA